jgi:hypothetical protein
VTGEPAPDQPGLAQRPPGSATVAAAVPVDLLLRGHADQCAQLGAVGRIQQRDREAVGAVRGMGQRGPAHLVGAAVPGQPVMHAVEVLEQRAAGVRDGVRTPVQKPAPHVHDLRR